MRNFRWVMVLFIGAALLPAYGEAHEAPVRAKKEGSKPTLPARKSGLWEVTERSDDLVLKRHGQASSKPQTVLQCTRKEDDAYMLLPIKPGRSCGEVKITRRAPSAGGGHDIRTVCYVHDNRVETRMELQGDLETSYRGAYEVKYAQTPMDNTGRRLFEGRWLGECKPGQRAGDMTLPNGITVNVLDDKKRAAMHGHEEREHRH